MLKESISVYNPSDPVERCVQDSYYAIHHEWLTAYPCQLIAKAITSLKFSSDWCDRNDLLKHRISYFFAQHMSRNKEVMVFLTHPIFVRDIFENLLINSFIYDPIVLVTKPLAHYIFREYPIHIHFKKSALQRHQNDWTDIGGLLIANQNVNFDFTDICAIKVINHEYLEITQNILNSSLALYNKTDCLRKVAITQTQPGMFELDDDQRAMHPYDAIWDKETRRKGIIDAVDPGDAGMVSIIYDDGTKLSVPKIMFDTQYSTNAGV